MGEYDKFCSTVPHTVLPSGAEPRRRALLGFLEGLLYGSIESYVPYMRPYMIVIEFLYGV